MLTDCVCLQYGLPLKHHLNVPASLSSTPILAIHDRWDQIIPEKGGEGNEGWEYNSLAVTSAAWGKVHGCNTTGAIPAKTPFDGGGRKMHCQQYLLRGTFIHHMNTRSL